MSLVQSRNRNNYHVCRYGTLYHGVAVIDPEDKATEIHVIEDCFISMTLPSGVYLGRSSRSP